MNKQEFFKEIKFALRRAEYEDVEAVLDYYDEIIMERKERGENEENIIASLDSADKIAANVEKTINRQEKKKAAVNATTAAIEKPGAKSFGKAIFTVMSLPVTVPLMAVMFVLVLVITIVTFALIIALWAVCVSLIAAGFAVAIGGTVITIIANSWMLAFGCLAGGCIIFAIGMWLLSVSVSSTRGVFKMSAKLLNGTVRLFAGKKRVK